MAHFVAFCFLLHVLLKRLGEVHAGLVRKTDEDPKNVCHFIGKIGALTRFERLLPIGSSHDSRQFSDFLGEARQVGQFVKIAHADGANPFVHFLLHLPQAGGGEGGVGWCFGVCREFFVHGREF